VGGPLAGAIASLADYPAIFYVMVAAAVASAALTAASAIRSPVAAGEQ